ncbi:hypothetical protein H2198_004006 [Neophaeococcomyces mojaviensis]|uniref:Uncharacterized protein n=1 Tax=Neophaeococcomyces mojaviensis TaxID=3383035 RepID=A0ACC3A9S1_9EURO|nr:hypothetical protein H2198_004006 [Knufia sp. JES_112]
MVKTTQNNDGPEQEQMTSKEYVPPARTPQVLENDIGQDANTIESISPMHQPHDMFFNRDHASNRMKMMGASSWACLTHTLNLYLRRAGLQQVSRHFKYGMRHAEEFHLPLTISLPALPPMETRQRYIDTYFDRIHRLWPLFDVDATKAAIHQFATTPKLEYVQQEQIPLLVGAYLIMSLGADEEAQSLTRDGDIYLQAASTLIAHILFVAYLPTVQSLLLLTIVFRGRNKDGLAWQTIGMAIRVAQSIGLHRHSVVKPSQDHGVTQKAEQLFHARIWGIACCLDKIMQIESGRPSQIGSVDKDQMMGPEQSPPGLDYLQWNMGIAEFQASISDHMYGCKPGNRTSRQLLLDTARLDKALLDWSNQLPPEFHPSNELFCADADFHIAAHLSIQYHQAMIALHRAALIAPTAQFEAEVARQCPDEPSRFRLKGGEMICIKSARSIARLMIELADKKTESRIVTAGPAMLACIVIAIYTAKNPAGRMQAADLELLKACATHVKDQYLKSGQDEVFAQGVVAIYEEVNKYVRIVRSSTSSVDAGTKAIVPSTTTNSGTTAQLSGNGVGSDNNAVATSQLRREHKDCGTSSWIHQQQLTSAAVPEMLISSSVAGQSNWQNQIPAVHVNGAYWNDDNGEDNYQNGVESQPLPFDDYNVEELWNWMLLMDSSSYPMEDLGDPSHRGN